MVSESCVVNSESWGFHDAKVGAEGGTKSVKSDGSRDIARKRSRICPVRQCSKDSIEVAAIETAKSGRECPYRHHRRREQHTFSTTKQFLLIMVIEGSRRQEQRRQQLAISPTLRRASASCFSSLALLSATRFAASAASLRSAASCTKRV